MTMTSSHSPSQHKEMPAWVSLLIIVLALAGAAGLVYWYWVAANPARRIVLSPDSSQGRKLAEERDRRRGNGGGFGGGGPPPRREIPMGVSPDGNDAWFIRGGDARVRIAKNNNDGKLNFRFDYMRPDMSTKEQNDFFFARDRLSRDDAMAKAAGLSQEQIDKLKSMPGWLRMKIDDADREALKSLWATYEPAPDKAAVEQTLVTLVEGIGKKNLDATKQEIVTRAAAIKAVLTDEQWANYRKTQQ